MDEEWFKAGYRGFAAVKDTIYVSITHKEFRKAQFEYACWSIRCSIKKLFTKNPILELRHYAITNTLAL